MRVSMDEFLTTGTFAGLAPGASRAEVVAALGEPTDCGSNSDPRLELMKYQSLEVLIEDGRLLSIQFEFHEKFECGGLEFAGWLPVMGVSRDDVVAHLDASDIAFEEESPY